MRVQPIRPITQAYFRRQKPYVLYECEACSQPGKITNIAGEAHLLCQDCTAYMEQVCKVLPEDSLDLFERLKPKLKKVCWIIIIAATVMILAQLFRWWLVA